MSMYTQIELTPDSPKEADKFSPNKAQKHIMETLGMLRSQGDDRVDYDMVQDSRGSAAWDEYNALLVLSDVPVAEEYISATQVRWGIFGRGFCKEAPGGTGYIADPLTYRLFSLVCQASGQSVDDFSVTSESEDLWVNIGYEDDGTLSDAQKKLAGVLFGNEGHISHHYDSKLFESVAALGGLSIKKGMADQDFRDTYPIEKGYATIYDELQLSAYSNEEKEMYIDEKDGAILLRGPLYKYTRRDDAGGTAEEYAFYIGKRLSFVFSAVCKAAGVSPEDFGYTKRGALKDLSVIADLPWENKSIFEKKVT